MSKQQRTHQHTHGQPMLTVIPPTPPQDTVHLTLHETDLVTGNEDTLSTLFYECYRGYTIYSTAQGVYCIHGAGWQRCLRLQGKFVSFPDIEEAKTLIKWFRAESYTSTENMDRAVPQEIYKCVKRNEPQRTPALSRSLRRVS